MEAQTLERILFALIEANKTASLLNAIGFYMLIGIAIVDAIALIILIRVWRETSVIRAKIDPE